MSGLYRSTMYKCTKCGKPTSIIFLKGGGEEYCEECNNIWWTYETLLKDLLKKNAELAKKNLDLRRQLHELMSAENGVKVG